MTVEGNQLSRDELVHYGKLATKLRQRFQEKANSAKRQALTCEDKEDEDFEIDVPVIYR